MIVHAVLEELVVERSILADDWSDRLEACWQRLVETERMSARHAGLAEPEWWPDFALKHARLKRMASRLRALLESAGSGDEFLPELELAATQWSLRGRADLVVRGALCAIVDFKSGDVLDEMTGEVREAYERQLLLYAVMEAETSGNWPTRLVLLPARGPEVTMPVDVARAIEVAKDAHDRLVEFNARVPGPQPPSPTEEACSRCHYVAMCPGFWDSRGSNWFSDLGPIRGAVRWVEEANGLVSFEIESEYEGETFVVRAANTSDFPELRGLRAGQHLAIVGAEPELGRATVRLRSTARCRVIAGTG